MLKAAAIWCLLLSLNCSGAARSVAVCNLHTPNLDTHTVWLAEHYYAKRIYEVIGIDLHWLSNCAGAQPDVIEVEWLDTAPKNVPNGVLAVSYPFRPTGIRVMVFQDRLYGQCQLEAAALLGHVLAHEIGHVLLGHNGHSRTGIMKAVWNNSDGRAIYGGFLFFTEDNAEQMSRGPILLAKSK